MKIIILLMKTVCWKTPQVLKNYHLTYENYHFTNENSLLKDAPGFIFRFILVDLLLKP